MEVLLLGPLEVRASGERLPLGGPRQRALFADLALHAGEVVSMDTLLEDLWNGEPPPAAEAVVQNSVARLRRALGREVIETRSPGYVLRVEPGAIDARRFERLVRDAAPLPPAERAAALMDALALWRGTPFADLAFEPFLQTEIARLDELRQTALEDRLEAETELGHHDGVIADAAKLGALHPERERLCRLRMRALWRAGRQQEALDVYEATRRALDEQWGLEPSPETRALHLMILTQSPALDAPPEPRPPEQPIRRPVALLFVEALLPDELDLEEAGGRLEALRRSTADVAARHGGALASDAGVELVAAFGAEATHEDDVLRAARAAVELRAILGDRAHEARFAIGTGRLLVEGGRPVLVGGVVARARRALHEAGEGEIRPTAIAARLAGDAFELDPDGRLGGVRPGRPSSLVPAGPLVGRASELARLRAAFERAVATARPVHVVVVGEAGIGKSRLLTSFAEGLDDAAVLATSCVSYGEGISFLPLEELATRAVALDDAAPAVGELVSADAAMTEARRLLEHFAATGPTVVIFDDLHWAMPGFLDLVEYVVRTVRGPLLVLAATRPDLLERRPGWSEHATILGALSEDDAARLVEALPEREALEPQVARSILGVAEGVPLFLEQLIAHAAVTDLRDEELPPTVDALLASRIDALAPGERAVLSAAAVLGRRFTRASLAAIAPETERAELDGRLGSLERRRLVRANARELEFVHPLVRRAAYESVARATRSSLHEQVARHLAAQGEGDELVGAHLERAAADAVPPDDRERLGREASRRLEAAAQRALVAVDSAAAANLFERAVARLPEDDPERLLAECGLAHALKGLGEWERAMDVLEDVARRAAVSQDRRAELRAEVELVFLRLTTGAETAEALTAFLERATVELELLPDPYGVARAQTAHGHVLEWLQSSDAAVEYHRAAGLGYRRLGMEGLGNVLTTGLDGSTPLGDALAAALETLESTADRPRQAAYALAHCAYMRALVGDIQGARGDAAVARVALHEFGELVGLQTVIARAFGSIEALAGDPAAAREIFLDACRFTESSSAHRAWHAYFLARLADLALAAADARAAVGLLERSESLIVVGDVETEILWGRVAARTLAATGRTRKPVRLAHEAVALADGTDALLYQGEARLDLAEVLRAVGRHETAAVAAREGLALIERKGALLLAEIGRARFRELIGDVADGGAAIAAPPSTG